MLLSRRLAYGRQRHSQRAPEPALSALACAALLGSWRGVARCRRPGGGPKRPRKQLNDQAGEAPRRRSDANAG